MESVTRSDFYRLFALGCFDIIVTLPLGIINVVSILLGTDGSIQLTMTMDQDQFYSGWGVTHSDWAEGPFFFTKDEWFEAGFWDRFVVYLDEWLPPFLCLVFFAIFGLTKDTRNMYLRVFRKITKSSPKLGDETSRIVFQTANANPVLTTSHS